MRGWAAAFGLICALIAGEAQAAKLIAVLPLDVRNTEGKLSKAAQASLEEMLRDTATNALTSAGWTILTGETTIQVLRDNGVKPEECGNQGCHLEMAREIKAEKFLSGNVQYVEGQYIASIRLIDTQSGRILASERVSGKSVTVLREAFEAKADAFFVKGGMLSGGAGASADRGVTPPSVDSNRPQVKKGTVTEAVGSLTVTAKPKDAVRLELVDPHGKQLTSGVPYENKAAAPGRWKVIAKASGYEDDEQTVEVPADDVTLVKIELKQLGGLTVAGEPAGAAVVVSGPGGFKDEGGLPWEATGLRSGTYQVRVSRGGYAEQSERVEVAPGKTATLKVSLKKSVARTEQAVPAAPPRPKTVKPAYDLSSAEILRKTTVYVKENYFDPTRIAPKEMLMAGLTAIAKSSFGVQVDGSAATGRVKVSYAGSTKEFRFDDIDNVWMVPLRVRPIFTFLQEQLAADMDRREVELAFVNGMLGSLDRNSYVIDAEGYRESKVQMKGEFGGVGCVLFKSGAELTVKRVIKNGPAARAGLQKGDVITRVNETDISSMVLNDVVGLMRGKPGSEVSLWIRRSGEGERERRLTREIVSVQTVTGQLLSGGIGVLRVNSFAGNTARDAAAAVRDLKEQAGGKLKGLVVDLRSNPGGLLEQGIQFADQFVEEGTIVTTVGAGGNIRDAKTAHNDGGERDFPMAVLVNESSASTAEIVAGALKNLNRAVVVGQQTFGKSLVQVLYEVPEPGTKEQLALKLSIAQYLSAGDKSFDSVGITPDVELVPVRPASASSESTPSNTAGGNPLAASRSAKGASEERPVISIRYQETGDGTPDEDLLASDPQVLFARELLERAPKTDRSGILNRATPFLYEKKDAGERLPRD
jgi:C-terminal peptidase prc